MLGTMTLVVRKCVRAYKLKTISGNKGTLNDWGMTLGVFVKEIQPNSFAKKVLHEYDEIIKVRIYVQKHHQGYFRTTSDEEIYVTSAF